VVQLPPGTRTAHLEGRTVSAAGVEIQVPGHDLTADPSAGAPGWLALRRLVLGPPGAGSGLPADGAPYLRIALEDGDPDRDAHDCWAAPRLTPIQVTQWESSLRGAWHLLCEHFPAEAEACAALCSCVVPLAPPRGRWVSVASREAFGAVGLSATHDTVRLAEALIHEVSHVALGALGDLVDLYDARWPARYRVAWRPDPRPLGAVLQGTYAHVTAAGFWQHYRQVAPPDRAERAERHFRHLRDHVLDALETLDGCPGLTVLGRRFCRGMAAAASAWPNDGRRIPESRAADVPRRTTLPSPAGRDVQTMPRCSNG
jgi:uncharacterized protein